MRHGPTFREDKCAVGRDPTMNIFNLYGSNRWGTLERLGRLLRQFECQDCQGHLVAGSLAGYAFGVTNARFLPVHWRKPLHGPAFDCQQPEMIYE